MWSIEHEGRDQRLLYKSSQETMVPLTQVVAVVVVRVRFCTSFKGGFFAGPDVDRREESRMNQLVARATEKMELPFAEMGKPKESQVWG